MKKTFAVVILTCLTVVAHAELFVDASRTAGKGKCEAGLNAGYSTTEYEFSGTRGPIAGWAEQEADRTVVSAYGAVGLTDWLDLFVSAGYIINSKGIWHTDASGFVVAGGAKAELWKRDRFSLMGYVQTSHLAEEYEEEDWYYFERVTVDHFPWGTRTVHARIHSHTPPDDGGPYEIVSIGASSTLTETALGCIGGYQFDRIAVYGGLEVVPLTDGEIESDLNDNKTDMERSTIFGVKAGATYSVKDDLLLRGEVTLVGEQTFKVGLSKAF